MTIQGYITNLGKYNEGELVGQWIEFPISREDFKAALVEIEIDGKEYEEYFFTDWDYADYPDFGFSEHTSIATVNDIAKQLEDYSTYDMQKAHAICEVWSAAEIQGVNLDEFVLYDDINNDYDLGYYWAIESGVYDAKSWDNPLLKYIDYEAFGRDIRLECDGGFTKYGFIERGR